MRKKISPEEALLTIIKIAGGKMKLSMIFDISPPAITAMVRKGKVSLPNVYKAHKLCKGKISLQEFRPDIYKE